MDNFEKRLLHIFEKFSLNASTFADKIGVQRSSMSHILSGRNKPSLDFILKIYEAFPEINLPWLALGEGNFLKLVNPISENINSNYLKNDPKDLELFNLENANNAAENNYNLKQEQILDSQTESEILKQENEILNVSKLNLDIQKNETAEFPVLKSISEIEQILFFYKDGTFKSYNPK